MWTIYAILDNVAQEFVGGHGALHVFRHAAQAVRMFDEIMGNPDNPIAKRAAEYDLVQLGELRTTTGHNLSDKVAFGARIDHQYEVILTGKAWLATKQGTPSLIKES